MRVILLVIVAIFLGKMVYFFNYRVGFNLSFVLLFILIMLPNIFQYFARKKYISTIEAWLMSKGVGVGALKWRTFYWNKLFWKTSEAQLICSVNEGECTYWFVCGDWLLGGFIKKVFVYRECVKEGFVFCERIN